MAAQIDDEPERPHEQYGNDHASVLASPQRARQVGRETGNKHRVDDQLGHNRPRDAHVISPDIRSNAAASSPAQMSQTNSTTDCSVQCRAVPERPSESTATSAAALTPAIARKRCVRRKLCRGDHLYAGVAGECRQRRAVPAQCCRQVRCADRTGGRVGGRVPPPLCRFELRPRRVQRRSAAGHRSRSPPTLPIPSSSRHSIGRGAMPHPVLDRSTPLHVLQNGPCR